MSIGAKDVKKLRDMTGAGMMEAKNALVEVKGDFDKAITILEERGAAIAAKKSARSAANGVIGSYIHTGNRIGAIVEVNVETDFVSKDKKFVTFANDLAMHIAGMNPLYVTEEEIPTAELKKQDDANNYVKEVVLMKQSYVKDSTLTVEDFVNKQIADFKENIQVKRFVRLELGGE